MKARRLQTWIAVGILLSLAAAGWVEASAPAAAALTNYVYLPLLTRYYPLLVEEGFEAGVVPPEGWSLIQTNYWETWDLLRNVLPGKPAFEGAEAAACEWVWEMGLQDEILLSPAFEATTARLDFHSFGDIMFCVDYDLCDLNVWLVIGDWDGGSGDDVLIHVADGDWTGNEVWSPSTVDITPYLPPGTPVRVAFEYVGYETNDAGLDAIRIAGQ